MTGSHPASRAVPGLLAATGVIAGATILARVTGVARWLVFSSSVGATCTGTAYSTANQLPNVLYEVVAGGALSAAVVPLLAGPLRRGDRAAVDRVASALLTWALVLLVPASLLLAVLAGPLVDLLAPGGGCERSALHASALRMLLVFAPQVALYGVGVVLTGVLQAHRRFLWPALAPLLSSLVVIASYLAFRAVSGGRGGDPAHLPTSAELTLSVGTTLGVVVLAVPLLVPVERTGTRLRPTLRFPAGVSRRALTLAGAGVASLLAQQLSVVVTLWLANGRGGAGTINVYQYVQAVYLLPYAVLAVPLATAAFPQLAEHAAAGDGRGYAATLARSTRLVVLAAAAGAALLIAVAPAVGAFFGAIDASRHGAGSGSAALNGLPGALTAFAPGLWGFALIAHLGRALYADGHARLAAGGSVAGWLVAAGGSVAIVLALVHSGSDDPARTLVGLGVAGSLGMTVAGVLLLVAVLRCRGSAALRGIGRAHLAAGLAAVLAVVAGRFVTDQVAGAGFGAAGGSDLDAGRSLSAGLLGAVAAVVVLSAVYLAADGADARALLATGRRRSVAAGVGPGVDPGVDPGVGPGVDPGVGPGVDPGVGPGVDRR